MEFMNATPKDIQAAYEAWHERIEVDVEANSPWHKMVKENLEPARDLLNKRVLEIGCGRGGFSCWLVSQSQKPNEVIAMDFAVTAIEKGRAFATQNGLSNIIWEVGDIQNIPQPDDSFDTVISCETVEHVPDPRKAISELARVLKPGGRLFLTTPNYLGTLGLYRIYLRLRGRRYSEVDQPINNLTLLPLTRKWVANTDLQVQKIDAIGHYLPFPGRPPIELPRLNNPRFIMRWFGLHSLVVGEKLKQA